MTGRDDFRQRMEDINRPENPHGEAGDSVVDCFLLRYIPFRESYLVESSALATSQTLMFFVSDSRNHFLVSCRALRRLLENADIVGN